jgi:hypothetical protein
MEHAAGLHEVTRLEVTLPPSAKPSPPLQAVFEAGLLQRQTGEAYLVDLGFDHEECGELSDFRPDLPLVLRR